MLTYTHSLKVRYSETDAMQRAHHSNFLIWFEACRIELLTHIGLPYDSIESSGFFIPVLSAEINYLKPLNFNDSFEVRIQLETKPKLSFQFSYEVHCKGTLIATGKTKHVFINSKHAVVRTPKFFLEKLNPYFQD